MPAPKDVEKMWREMSARITRLEQRSSLANTGFSVDDVKSLTFDGSMHVTGSMDVDGTANFDGDTTIGGNAAITGTLSLPAGIIDNDALAHPIVPATAHNDAQNFSVSTAWSTKCSVTVPVPAGFTQALILALSTTATALNSTAGVDFLYASASIAAYGGSLPGWVLGSTDTPAGKYGVTADFQTVLLTGLSGSFVIESQVSSAFGTWAANVSNKMNLDASILFLR